MQTYEAVWIRVAGNAMNIRSKQPDRWRCFIGRTGPEIPLLTWEVSGEASPSNFTIGTSADGDEPNGLAAWLDFFGDITIENGIARIRLRPIV